MKTKVKALQKFYHGNKMTESGKQTEFTKGDAEDLAKLGLVEIVADKAAPAPAPETKMEAAPKNKMADAPTKKASKKAD